MAKKFVLKGARLAYPFLFKPRVSKNEAGVEKEPEYAAVLILDKANKAHTAVIAEIEAEAKKMAAEKWGKAPVKLKMPFRDGDTYSDDETGEIKKGFENPCWGINAKCQNKPDVVHRDMGPITDPNVVYGGCYCNVVVQLYPWEHKTNGKGVSANLGAVQFVKDGERFGREQVKAADVFEPIEEEDEDDDINI